jgi:hypothetical protein
MQVGASPTASRLPIDDFGTHSYDFHRAKTAWLRKSALRMRVSIFRGCLCWMMLVAVPVSLLGQAPAGQASSTQPSSNQASSNQSASAILHTQGGVSVNDSEARDSTAVLAGDLIETKTGFSATLNLEGSTVQIQQESLAKFDGDGLELEHGSVTVGTSTEFKVRVKCMTVVPVVNEWTQYDVTDVNGTIQVVAHKLDVNVEHHANHGKAAADQNQNKDQDSDSSHGSIVHEGHEDHYEESQVCGVAARTPGAGPGLSPKWIGVGAAAATGVILGVVLHGGGGPPLSPSTP